MAELARLPERPVRTGLTRVLLIAAGSFFVAVGVAGIFLPLLPSFEFFLLAGLCYGRSSPAASRWLTTNRLFGRRLTDYRAGRGATVATKLWTGATLWGSIGATIFFLDAPSWLTLLLVAIATAVSLHLVMLRTIRR
jgi:uncharacterized membrane protein YbaN (DUF454 family)